MRQDFTITDLRELLAGNGEENARILSQARARLRDNGVDAPSQQDLRAEVQIMAREVREYLDGGTGHA